METSIEAGKSAPGATVVAAKTTRARTGSSGDPDSTGALVNPKIAMQGNIQIKAVITT
jgi:hypothetical protein